jgi:hypothetical protein
VSKVANKRAGRAEKKARFRVGQVVYWKPRHDYMRVTSVWFDSTDDYSGGWRYNIVDPEREGSMVLTSRHDVEETQLRPLTAREIGPRAEKGISR